MKKTIVVNEPVFDELTSRGQKIRKFLDAKHITAFNIMASPGAGKTSIIMQTIKELKISFRIGVIEGDIVPIDVEKIQQLDIPVVLAHTGGSCHLDSIMMEKALEKLPLEKINLLIVENVGNLICPASFYLGTHKNVVIASVPEGDDKPFKYPTMFKGADIVLLNKTDYLDKESFDVEYFKKGINALSPAIQILEVSAKTGKGIPQWIDWIQKNSMI